MTERLNKFVAELAELTDCNDHSGSLVLLVNEFDCLEHYRKDAVRIQSEHMERGSITYGTRAHRDEIRKMCVTVIRREYGNAFADKINMAM